MMKKLHCILCIVLPFILLTTAFPQTTTVTGKVTNTEGKPVENVSVVIKGTTNGTLTNNAGTYKLTVAKPSGNTLVITSVGYTEQEIAQTSNTINVQLDKTTQSLDAVVVVGYGTQKRKDITGAVVSIDKQRLENLPNSNFAQALEGSLPGVSVNTNGGGAEGNSLSITIRGRKSVSGSNNPIIILDGIPYNGAITDINPSDIASLEILKDASAAAIYGSKAANGIILITTKKGVNGKPTITYDGFTGLQRNSNLPPVLLGEDFYNFKVTREGIGAITVSEKALYDQKKFTNWLDLGTREGMRTQHTLSARGGSTNFKYYAGLTYLDVKGVAVNDNYKRLSTRVNLEANFTNWLTYGTNTQLSYNDRSGVPVTFSGDYGVYTFNPLTSPYDSAGNLTIYPWKEDQFFANPLAPTLASNQDLTYKIFTTNYFQVQLPLKGLSYRINTGVDYQNRTISTFYGRNTRTGIQTNGSLSQSNNNERNMTIENLLNYNNTFGEHTIGFTGLYSYQYRNTVTNTLSAENFPSDVLTFYQANQALLAVPRTGLIKETLLAQMARLNYSYNSRYLLTLTARRDGYSGFGANNKYGIFPSAAIGWNLTSEKFFPQIKAINNIKIRLSYGSVGNQANSPYQTLARLSNRLYIDNATIAAGYIPTSLGNPNLKWETTNQGNLGMDFALLDNRLTGTMDYYNTNTHDLLLTRSISPVQGIPQITQNIGRTNNKGFEVALNTINIRSKDFSWSSNINFSFNRNKFVDVYGDGKNDTASRYFIGYPIDVNFGYVFNGVYQLTDDTVRTPQGAVRPGYAKVKDLNNDGVINGYDRTILGTTQPDFLWGLANTFKYKNLSLYVFMHGVQGRYEPNSLMSDNNVNAGVRYTTVVKNWWTPTNPTNDFYANTVSATKNLTVPIVQNSSFVRIKDILLSYDLPSKVLERLKLTRFKIYVETRNPFTFTKWTGLDPEFSSQTAIPLQKEYIVGATISL